jgi:hypothetical protein
LLRIGATEAAIELGAYDFAHVLGNKPDDEFDDPFFAPAVALTSRSLLALVDDVSHPFGDEEHDRVDDPFLLESTSAVIAVAVAMTAAVAMAISVAVAVPPAVLLAARSQAAFERLQAFEDFAPLVIAHNQTSRSDRYNG